MSDLRRYDAYIDTSSDSTEVKATLEFEVRTSGEWVDADEAISEIDELKARIEKLEGENRELRNAIQPSPPGTSGD